MDTEFVTSISILLLGLAFGSFAGALSYRLTKAISIFRGRSFCPNCKRKISAKDNIPLLSFLLLQGKCRQCKEKIPFRYVVIEFSIAILFLVLYKTHPLINLSIPWLLALDQLSLFYILAIAFLFSVIFIVDIENQIIPDSLVFLIFTLTLLGVLVSNGQIFEHLLSGMIAAVVFLLLHFATKGQGMGLGDVKLAMVIGTILGTRLTIVWFMASFFLGAIFGILLILLRRAKIKDRIAFGPFMILSFLLTLYIPETLSKILVPIL